MRTFRTRPRRAPPRRGRGDVEPEREVEAEHGEAGRYRHGAEQQRRDVAGEEPCHRRRNHEERAHEQRPHGGKRRHRGERHRAEEQDVGAPYRQAESTSGVGIEADGRPRAAKEDRCGQRKRRRGTREREVRSVETDRRSEEKAVDGRSRLEDVAGQQDPASERGHEQQAGGAVAGVSHGASGTLHAARVGRRGREPRQRGAEAGGVRHHEGRKRGGAHRVSEERQPAKHHEGTEQAATYRQQGQLREGRAGQRQVEQVQRRGYGARVHPGSVTRIILAKADGR